MKRFIFGTVVGAIVGVLVQDKWDAKKKVTEKVGEAWDWTKKKIDDLKEDVKENIDDLNEEAND